MPATPLEKGCAVNLEKRAFNNETLGGQILNSDRNDINGHILGYCDNVLIR